MTNSLQTHSKSDKKFQILCDLNLMTILSQTHIKTSSKCMIID
jgi:hypothetical protein